MPGEVVPSAQEQEQHDAVYRSGRGLRVRAVHRDVHRMEWDHPTAWMCCNCGQVPGSVAPETPPAPTCFNCQATLYVDDAQGAGPTKEERLSMQVHALRVALYFDVRLSRALAEAALTGRMPEGWAPAEVWHKAALANTGHLPAVLRETWRDHGGPGAEDEG